ncbi:Protein of unknown function [Pyronema omphalodes CBS 100304]|uniref:Uncharacterized protein n=1 Tax=Pyronema omphalodes (strain CBS 100304) TaxID=1076935 RepID=U4LDT8_PYROM|nr:Protein of unknown function [Pyronema omphalodes CBS 100304]
MMRSIALSYTSTEAAELCRSGDVPS